MSKINDLLHGLEAVPTVITGSGSAAADARHEAIIESLPKLSQFQVSSIGRIIAQLQRERTYWRNEASDLVSEGVLEDFGDALRIHHVFSAEALSKDRFEFALESVLNGRGVSAVRAARGNPGHDITIRGVPCSLKTQANKTIQRDAIHISKYMELGKGTWTNQVADLDGLRARFLAHMTRYERIFTLRRLRDPENEFYELVEIPKALLQEAETSLLTIQTTSTQTPPPGNCRVLDGAGTLKFELYFDGGTERKLQVKHLKKSLCIVHATWRFARQKADAEEVFEETS